MVMRKPTARTALFRDADGRVVPGSVAEAGVWAIGGVDQWVMVRGRDRENPLLIMLHGGPGSSETAFFRSFNADLEDAFTVVYWDQRGAGRSYRKSIPAQSMTIDRFVADLDELVDALLARFGKRQVVLLGHSWGSVLGILYASRFPAKVAAYVGVGQVADMAASEAASYVFVLGEAERRGHRAALKQLRAIGPPPHDMKALGRQRRWLMALGGAFGPNLSLFQLVRRGLRAPEASPVDLVRLIQGSTFSLRALWPQLMATDIQRDFRRFGAPLFFFLGRRDMQVVATVAAAYFEVIEAPHKELIWFENSGHMAPFEEPQLFNALMVEKVRPFAT
jgi:proline iminopeptidase